MLGEASRPLLVLGTAGHIDHGKTRLVAALTGVDTDRLPEERRRGISIELGFAALELSAELRLGVVDVPGHERLVRTMVAGAAGIDLLLLVVAADEGVMPQTREHVAICELLGVDRGVVALTKCDRAEPDVQELAALEVRELLAETPLAGAPIVRVSATTGAGLDALRTALADAATKASPRTKRRGPPRLPIDRTFTMRGFGTVVTGTLLGAPLTVGDLVEIQPSGLRARIRGLQQHGAAAERVLPGARCAANLQGVEVEELARGDVVTAPGALRPTRVLDVHVRWLPGAPAVREHASVELLSGTAERRARLAPIGTRVLSPGQVGFARLHVTGKPLAVLPGDRFVLQGFARTDAGGTTLGGGVVLDTAPPRRRRSDPALLHELEALLARKPATDLVVRVARAGLSGVRRDRLAAEMDLEPRVFEAALEVLAKEGRVIPTLGGTLLSDDAAGEIGRRLAAELATFHEREPLRPGMPRAALRGALPENVRPDALELVLERLAAEGRVVAEGDLVRLVSHRAALEPADEALAERLIEGTRAAGLEPPTLKEWAERTGEAPERLRELLAWLARQGRVVPTRGDLWFDRDAIDTLRRRVVTHLRSHGAIETPDYKGLIGTTRKHAVPLMELFDAERVTLRVGNRRTLRGGAAGGSSERR